MEQILECVPNFSEGRDQHIISQICNAIEKVEGVWLLHCDMGYDANRTVLTFAGKPLKVVEAAVAAIEQATHLIDMQRHTGAHPCFGATDVCPFIPIRGLTLEDADYYAQQAAKQVAETLNLPVYLYEKSATARHRMSLANIRNGGFEGLTKKMEDAEWIPDFGPTEPHPTAGALALGARKILIAYNINLNTTDVVVAKRIAALLRETGSTIIRPDGTTQQTAGAMKNVKAIGWLMPEFGCAQVSCNITDIDLSPVHTVYEKTREIARMFGAEVTGSELIGLIPLECMTKTADFYHKNLNTEAEKIEVAINKLGLNSLKPFNPNERILEYLLSTKL